jgi:zinc and cadmium transporter
LSFSGAFLFAICVLHLIPELYESNGINVGLYILIGFFFQILLEYFSEGIEHGHIHIHKEHSHAFPLTMMISLCVHSFLEGMPLVNTGTAHEHHGHYSDQLLAGIVLHNIPISIALMSMLLQSQIKRSSAIFCLVVFALMAPLGSLFSYYIGSQLVGDISVYFNKIMAVVIGIFLHISTTILFESTENHRFNLLKMITIIAGALVALAGS